jgi:primosomal protein N' (replication factor Y)
VIRSAFADKQSIVFVTPSIRSLEYWYAQLKKGIGDHVVLLHSKRTKRDQKSALSTIKQSSRPLLICATPHFAQVPRHDNGVLILEEESSTLYKTNDRYEVDTRTLLTSIAQAHGIHTICGDVLPRFETLITTNTPGLARSYVPDKVVIAPTEPYRSVLPAEAIELIRYCQKNKKTLFLYTNRKGIAPLSRCADCGTIVECPTCTLPIVLRYKVTSGEKERLFSCSHCGDMLPSTHVCTLCGSWNITPVSIGTDSLYDAVKQIVDEEHIVTIDDESTPDTAEVEKTLTALQKRKWYIMIGTQKMMPFIKSIDYTIIPFFDRILSTPSPYTVEETLRLIMECNERTKENLVLCTRHPDFPLTTHIATRKIQTLIDEDIEHRKTFGYPPFGVLLKLSVTVSSGHRESVTEKIESFFKDCDISAGAPRRISPETMKLLCTWVVSVSTTYLDDEHEALLSFLESLRVPYKIDTHPVRL